MSLRLVSGGYDHTIRVWDAVAGTSDQTFPFNDSQVNQVLFSPDGRLIAVCGNPRVCFYDLASNSTSPVYTLDYHRSSVCQLSWNDQGYALSCSEDGWIAEWDFRRSIEGEPLRVLKNRDGGVGVGMNSNSLSGVVYASRRGYCFTCDYQGCVKMWCLESKRIVARMVFGDEEILSGIVLDPVHHLVACTGSSGYTYLCRVTEEATTTTSSSSMPSTEEGYFTRVTKLRCSKRYVLKARFNRDASWLVSAGDDGNVRVWGAQDAIGPNLPQNATEISCEQRYQDAHWQTQRLVGKHQKWAWDCHFTRDSRYVLSASSDKRICLWDIETGDLMKEYKGHQKAITSIDLFPKTTTTTIQND